MARKINLLDTPSQGTLGEESYVPSKKGLFSVLGDVLVKTSVGLNSASDLAQINQREYEAQQQIDQFISNYRMQNQRRKEEKAQQALENFYKERQLGLRPTEPMTQGVMISPDGRALTQDPNTEANLDLMIKRQRLKDLMNPRQKEVYTVGLDGELVPVGMVPKGSQVVAPMQIPSLAGEITARKERTVREGKLNELNSVIDFFEQKINEVPSGEGFGGRLKGAQLGLEAALQTNPDAAAYEASINGLRSQIARGLGEVGNLAEDEQKNAIKLLPNITDNTETRIKKLQNFREYVDTKLQGSVYGSNKSSEKSQKFVVNGKTYNIPSDQVEEFKKDMGIK